MCDMFAIPIGKPTGPSAIPATGCYVGGSCDTQKDWGAILDDYNNGLYEGGPLHCGNE